MKTVLNVRVDNSLKEQIKDLAFQKNIPPSELIRIILNEYFESEDYLYETVGVHILNFDD